MLKTDKKPWKHPYLAKSQRNANKLPFSSIQFKVNINVSTLALKI